MLVGVDDKARAVLLAGVLADRLSAAMPAWLDVRAEHDALVVRSDGAVNMVVHVRPFGSEPELVEAIAEVLIAVRDEAESESRVRHEAAVAAEDGVVRVWFGRLVPPSAAPPWRDILPELAPVAVAPLLDPGVSTTTVDAVVMRDSDPYLGGMAGVESVQPVRSMTLVGRRTRGYRVDVYRADTGLGITRQGRRRVLRLGSLRVEWYPK